MADDIIDVDELSPEEVATRIVARRRRRRAEPGGRAVSAPMREIEVALGDRSYPVLIGDGVRHELSRLCPEGQAGDRGDPGDRREGGVAGRSRPGPAVRGQHHRRGGGEQDARHGGGPLRRFAQTGLSRSDVVIAVGGGIVTDVAGFAAASYHRGTPYVNVATTLLGQVDAAIGGKTGVNLPEGKNLVGAFWQPSAVLCDTETLTTLSPREWACGKGEMAKYAFLGEPPRPETEMEEQVARCVAIKAEVVAADEREGDRRMILNYGHTLAHALEAAGLADHPDWDLRHGEAVAIGLIFAALLAQRLGRIDEGRVEEHRAVVGSYDLPMELPAGAAASELVDFMGRDKKAQQDLTFVLDGPRGSNRFVAWRVLTSSLPWQTWEHGCEEAPMSLIVLLSGPNLNLLGEREPAIYGTQTLADHVARAESAATRHGLTVEHHQSNDEGALVGAVHAARGRAAALVINAGALSHTSWSLHDAVAAFEGPVVELHLSNPAAREPFRHTSVLAPVTAGLVAGFGGLGYELAVDAVAQLLKGAS